MKNCNTQPKSNEREENNLEPIKIGDPTSEASADPTSEASADPIPIPIAKYTLNFSTGRHMTE